MRKVKAAEMRDVAGGGAVVAFVAGVIASEVVSWVLNPSHTKEVIVNAWNEAVENAEG